MARIATYLFVLMLNVVTIVQGQEYEVWSRSGIPMFDTLGNGSRVIDSLVYGSKLMVLKEHPGTTEITLLTISAADSSIRYQYRPKWLRISDGQRTGYVESTDGVLIVEDVML